MINIPEHEMNSNSKERKKCLPSEQRISLLVTILSLLKAQFSSLNENVSCMITTMVLPITKKIYLS